MIYKYQFHIFRLNISLSYGNNAYNYSLFLVPTAKPELVEAFSNDYTSISVFWNPIRESMRNGIIIMYRIFYRLQEAEVFKTQRVGRSIITQHNRTASGRQSGESYFNVNGSLTSATIYNLKPFRWYIVRIGGVTKAGLGPVAVLNASCGQGGK